MVDADFRMGAVRLEWSCSRHSEVAEKHSSELHGFGLPWLSTAAGGPDDLPSADGAAESGAHSHWPELFVPGPMLGDRYEEDSTIPRIALLDPADSGLLGFWRYRMTMVRPFEGPHRAAGTLPRRETGS